MRAAIKPAQRQNEALRLQPDLAEAHLAMGLVYYYIDHEYEQALSELDLARKELPNDARLSRAIAAIQRRQGQWEKSIASYNKALAVDPKRSDPGGKYGDELLAVRELQEAAGILDRAVALAPDTFTSRNCGRVSISSRTTTRADEEIAGDLPSASRSERNGDFGALQLPALRAQVS